MPSSEISLEGQEAEVRCLNQNCDWSTTGILSISRNNEYSRWYLNDPLKGRIARHHVRTGSGMEGQGHQGYEAIIYSRRLVAIISGHSYYSAIERLISEDNC